MLCVPSLPSQAGEDGTAPGCMAYFGFAVTLPWKIVFACIPPTIFWGGASRVSVA
jgi:hypothetical protein